MLRAFLSNPLSHIILQFYTPKTYPTYILRSPNNKTTGIALKKKQSLASLCHKIMDLVFGSHGHDGFAKNKSGANLFTLNPLFIPRLSTPPPLPFEPITHTARITNDNLS